MKIGRISENVLKRSVLQQIKTKCDEVVIGAGIGNDCAVFSFPENPRAEENDKYVTMSCLQEGFLDRGITLLLQKCVNRIGARGGKALSASLSFLLPAETEEALLKKLMTEAESFCRLLHIQIAEAGGRVSEAVAKPYGTVTIYGTAPLGERHTVRAAAPGQEIVISKWIGLEGTAVLAERCREKLKERFPSWLVAEAERFDRYMSTVEESAAAIQAGACAIHNVSEGGVFAALWELAEGAGVGLTVDLKRIPIKQETVEVCNFCNRNPYELLSEGCLLMTCADGAVLTAALEEAGIPAVTVGRITGSRDKLILNDGEARYLDRPHADEIYK